MVTVESRETLEKLGKDKLVALLVEQQAEIEKLQNMIRNANRQRFGPKTEKLSHDQLPLSFELDSIAPATENTPEITVEAHTRVKRGRKPLPDNLPREEIVYTPEVTHCGCCNSPLKEIGEHRTTELEKIPAQLKIIEHVRPKLACSNCKEAGVLVAPLPPAVLPLEGSRPGPGLLADIVVSKYVDHLPLHRQEEMYRRRGVEISRKRMCDWVAGVTELLLPLYEALKRELLSQSYLQADETTLKVQDGKTPNECHTGYLWGLHGPPNLIWFEYSPTRSGTVPVKILSGFEGAIQTDAYAGYNEVFVPEKALRLACLAHVRRKFLEVQRTAGKECNRILEFIAAIYSREKKAKSDEERLRARTTATKKTLEELLSFMETTYERTLPRTPFAQALKYALKQRQALLNLTESGSFELDNNAIERQMKQVAIGRKNYYFAGSHAGADRAAILYSLLGTCRLNKVNPWEWLRAVLSAVHTHPAARVQELLPQHWKVQPAS